MISRRYLFGLFPAALPITGAVADPRERALYIGDTKVLELYNDERDGEDRISLCIPLGTCAAYRKKGAP